MTFLQRQHLYERNEKIIKIILQQIKRKCHNCVDLIGIGGSFCNGDIYENSDLDLVIIANDKSANVLDKCFILENIGFDIYTQDWSKLERMSEYTSPYVTKLFDLDIVYKLSDEILCRYYSLQQKLKENMQDDDKISIKIGAYFTDILKDYDKLISTNNTFEAYKYLARIIKNLEYIIYMLNKTYVKKGTKRIPQEISNMNILPDEFLATYLEITNFKTLDDIRNKVLVLVNSMKKLLDKMNIKYNCFNINKEIQNSEILKRQISSDDITGTYEEIYSNWRNKMYHAIQINNRYLSFVTMASCQEFYDQMSNEFDISNVELIDKYNSNDLKANAFYFDKAMNEWKKLYDLFDKDVIKYNSLDDLENLYS